MKRLLRLFIDCTVVKMENKRKIEEKVWIKFVRDI